MEKQRRRKGELSWQLAQARPTAAEPTAELWDDGEEEVAKLRPDTIPKGARRFSEKYSPEARAPLLGVTGEAAPY